MNTNSGRVSGAVGTSPFCWELARRALKGRENLWEVNPPPGGAIGKVLSGGVGNGGDDEGQRRRDDETQENDRKFNEASPNRFMAK
jgi:hypothetical protein